MRDGSRKVIGVSEVVGMEGDIVTMQEIVRFSQRGVDKENKVVGEFAYTGVQPDCLKRFEEYGVAYDSSGSTSSRCCIGMVSTLAPFAIFARRRRDHRLDVLLILGIGQRTRDRQASRTLSDQLERAAINMSAQEIVLIVAGGVALVWISCCSCYSRARWSCAAAASRSSPGSRSALLLYVLKFRIASAPRCVRRSSSRWRCG